MGVFNCSMFCCTFLYVPSSFAIILMGKRELVALLMLSSWCLVIVVWLILAVPWVCLQFVIVEFPDHNNLLFLKSRNNNTGIKYQAKRLLSSACFFLVAQELTTTRTCDINLSRDMWFPTMWHFDKCRLRRVCAAAFDA